MSYSVNTKLFKSIFAVPTDIVDKHIRLATGDQLKVLLWILRNDTDNPDIKTMCEALKMNESDASDYLQYWVLTGVLSTEETEDVPVKKKESESVKKPVINPEKEIEDVTPSKPSLSELTKRSEESPEIEHLFNEAQSLLGSTFGYNTQCTLLMVHDHYGLPVEVIFMMLDYCVSVGKTNSSYILAVGKDWGVREIDTLDKAAEQITILRNSNSIWKELAIHAGFSNSRPTVKQSEYIRRWIHEWKFNSDMIIPAYEEMINHTGKLSFSYMDKIPVCTHYLLNGKQTDSFPFPTALKNAQPVIEYFDGWKCDISHVRKWEELPVQAQEYIAFIEKQIGCPIKYISVGAQRDSIIIRNTEDMT